MTLTGGYTQGGPHRGLHTEGEVDDPNPIPDCLRGRRGYQPSQPGHGGHPPHGYNDYNGNHGYNGYNGNNGYNGYTSEGDEDASQAGQGMEATPCREANEEGYRVIYGCDGQALPPSL